MSSQPPAGSSSAPAHSRRGSLSRALSKIKNTITRRHSSRVESTEEATEPAIDASTALPTTAPPAPTSAPAVAIQEATNAPSAATESGQPRVWCEELEIDEDVEDLNGLPPISLMVPIGRGASAQTRAIIMCSKWNLDYAQLEGLPQYDDGPRNDVTRVEKKIKMRVRHSCHKCNTVYAQGRNCRDCGHYRCPECPREPARRRHHEMSENILHSPAHTQHTGIHPEHPGTSPQEGLNQDRVLIVHRSSEGPGRPSQRVQYFCHRCESPFVVGTAHHCPNCGHQRCNVCPRQLARPVLPPKQLDQIITLEPQTAESPARERVWRTPRQRIKWACHECNTSFKFGERNCRSCKHNRCDQCSRIPPRRIRNESSSHPVTQATQT